ncbi:lipopolysaccharide transport periplasmic protein LptA [Nitrosospira sp. Nsp1]|uniref:lipopolysaccharide transport periplasmic protein LptA n=1 Tax=Nitrosospira sp. Nsp1 TaxID=136547 RepID=UPI00087E6F9E|nr:lipopolysaccharide transport periplasmic protein LptA [Nitrosospira sp. Nsp1]SCX51821.1 lipopolysaccharide export system protein LptA [Nitrosospira sp. Nsp1]
MTMPAREPLSRCHANSTATAANIARGGIFFTVFFASLLFTGPVLAERADSDKPVHLESDRATVQDANKLATFIGNVVLTQGTLIIRADKMTVKEDASGFQHATAFGNLASFRQKRDGKDEYVEGWSERMEYDAKADKVQLFKKARLRRGQDEVHGDYISYDALNEFFQVTGNNDTSAQSQSEGRVRLVIQPKKKEPKPDAEKDE